MANPLTVDGGREFQPVRILESFVWEEIHRLASSIVILFIMLRWPLVYEARLARLERSSGEQLALGQTPAERSARASTQPFDEPDPLGIQKGQSLVNRCGLEWQACVMLNTAALGYAFPFTLLPVLTQVAV